MGSGHYSQSGSAFDGGDEKKAQEEPSSYTTAQSQAPLSSPASSAQKQAQSSKSAGKAKAAGAFKTISEVAEELDVQQHVLRFWETKFSYVKPLKRGGGRRYYRPEDVALLKSIHQLLYTEGYTIKGVQKLLREKGKNFVVESGVVVKDVEVKAGTPQSYEDLKKPEALGLDESQKEVLRSMLDDLKDLRRMIGKTGD